jgi:hypothetical protein
MWRTVAINTLAVVGTFSAVTCLSTSVGIVFESRTGRLILKPN